MKQSGTEQSPVDEMGNFTPLVLAENNGTQVRRNLLMMMDNEEGGEAASITTTSTTISSGAEALQVSVNLAVFWGGCHISIHFRHPFFLRSLAHAFSSANIYTNSHPLTPWKKWRLEPNYGHKIEENVY